MGPESRTIVSTREVGCLQLPGLTMYVDTSLPLTETDLRIVVGAVAVILVCRLIVRFHKYVQDRRL